MSVLDRFTRLIRDRGLRPTDRSSSLISMANSLASIAQALKIIVHKEYHIDLDAPQPSRRDLNVEVFEPIYADNHEEAIREALEQAERVEADLLASDHVRGNQQVREMRLTFEGSGRGAGSAGTADELTPEEVRFLAELDTDADER